LRRREKRNILAIHAKVINSPSISASVKEILPMEPDEIWSALRIALVKQSPLIEPQAARTWQSTLQRALGGSVEDITVYRTGRSYRFARTLPIGEGEERWRTVLRVSISAVGPYTTHTFVQGARQEAWWAGPIRTSRNGFSPEHAEAVTAVRSWYQEQSLQEVHAALQALPVPDDIRVPRVRQSPTMFVALFGD
jgi:hypothetical protein